MKKPLLYLGAEPMNPHNIVNHKSPPEAARLFNELGYVYIHLEPGDGTAYRFVLSRIPDGWVIAPLSGLGGKVRSYDLLIANPKYISIHDFTWIGNEWSRELLAWWIREWFYPTVTGEGL